MTNEEQMAYGLLAVAGNEKLLKPKLDEYIKRREEAEAAERKVLEQQAALEKTREDVNLHVAQKTEALNAAQAKHDEAAKEAHKRIILAQEQDEILQRKADALALREKDATARETELKRRDDDLTRREKKLKSDTDRVNTLSKELQEKHAKLRELLT